MNVSDARKAHKILDDLFKRKPVLDEEREFLRNALPELPKQKTLEEIHEEVYEKWLGVEGDLWDSDNWGTVEEFLGGLQYQLKDLIDAEPAKPAHPKFLETEADYKKAPEGTIVACDDNPPLHKSGSAWFSAVIYGGNSAKSMSGVIRRVLRWGMLNEQL